METTNENLNFYVRVQRVTSFDFFFLTDVGGSVGRNPRLRTHGTGPIFDGLKIRSFWG